MCLSLLPSPRFLAFSLSRFLPNPLSHFLPFAFSRFLCLLLVLLILAAPAYAGGSGTSGSAVLKIGVGAKPTGMGEASIAVPDISSIYWNPAGLIQIRNSQLAAMHIEWLDDIRYEWMAYAQPLTSRATIAADVSYMHTGSIVRTIESPTEGYEENGTFSAADMAGRIAFAGKALEELFVGGSLQILQSRVDFDNVTKAGIGDRMAQSTVINLGCLYNTPIPDLSLGCSLRNLGNQTQAFIKEEEALPFNLGLGVSYKVLVAGAHGRAPLDAEGADENQTDISPQVERAARSLETSEVSTLVLAMDLNLPAQGSIGFRMGAEYLFSNGIAIRGGYRTGTGFEFPSGLSVGAGYMADTYQLDYALVPYEDLGATHRISLTVKF